MAYCRKPFMNTGLRCLNSDFGFFYCLDIDKFNIKKDCNTETSLKF